MELSCFFDDPLNVGNLISGSSAFSKSTFASLSVATILSDFTQGGGLFKELQLSLCVPYFANICVCA